jgi:hypothetical protein
MQHNRIAEMAEGHVLRSEGMMKVYEFRIFWRRVFEVSSFF